MPDRAGDGSVAELDSVAGRTQQQAAPAHVAAAHEVGREQEPFSEDLEKRRHVFVRRDRAEKDGLRLGAAVPAKMPQTALEGPPEGGLGSRDGDSTLRPEILDAEPRLGDEKAGSGRDDEARIRREARRVGEFSPEIKTRDEGEDVSETRAGGRS